MNEEINLAAPNQQKNGFILRPSPVFSKVRNVNKDGEFMTFSLPPEEAVIAAHAQSIGDNNTWNYAGKYKAKKGKYGWTCGDFWAAGE